MQDIFYLVADMRRQNETSDHRSICPVSAQSQEQTISRTKVAYWRNRVSKVKSKHGTESPDYSIRMVFENRRVRFQLHTSNKTAATGKAAKIYTHLVSFGWQATLEEYKPSSIQKQDEDTITTVGKLIDTARQYSTAREQSFATYARAFRRIVAGIMEIEDGAKHQTRGECGNKVWRERVNSTSLDALTPERIQKWKLAYLESKGRDAKARRSATTTVNSLIRNSKALFSKKLLPFLEKELELPSPLPFDGVLMEKAPSPRYRSRIDAKNILNLSHKTLKTESIEAYKILTLALVCGLRVSEIDLLLWEAFDFHSGILIIQDTKYHRLKSEDSAGEIHLSDGVASFFEDSYGEASGEFVIESETKAERKAGSGSYRCQLHLNTLKRWLHDNGVTANKPIHEMRKEIGSVIASEQGIFAASRYLRHSDIRITASIYADQKEKVIPSVGIGFPG